MSSRFTVIEGGRSEDAIGKGPSSGPMLWRVALRQVHGVEPAEIAAWRALLTRLRMPASVFADPDYLLTAAQHQADGLDIVFAFVTADDGNLYAVVPLAMPHSLWGNGRVRAWHPPGVTVELSIAPGAFEDVRAALLLALRNRRSQATLHLELVPAEPSAFARAVAQARPFPGDRIRSERAAASPRSLLGMRPAALPRDGSETERVVEPHRIRNAVEEFLTLDTAVSPRPIVGDPAQAAMVRVVTRLFAKRRQVSVELTRRNGRIVAGALCLGGGPSATVWRRAEGRLERPA